MQIISGLDNVFLNQEKSDQHMHVAGLGIYDQSTSPEGSVRFKTILEFFTSRLSESPVFRRRLVHPPLGIDRPYWIETDDVDVEYHVRHIGLPKPGDWRQLMIQIARLHSRSMDMKKPLWEAYVIEGLDNIPNIAKGSFALYTKFHHAAMDGEKGAEIVGAIHSLSPDDIGPKAQKSNSVIIDREPNSLEFITRTIGHRASQMFDASKLAVDIGMNSWSLGKLLGEKTMTLSQSYLNKYMGIGNMDDTASHKRPMTRFNKSISPHRVVDATGISLKDCKIIRTNVEGATINDIFLTVIGGAVIRYLESKDEVPDCSLLTGMPMSLRSQNDKKGSNSNQIAQMVLSLRTDIDDPIKRLSAIQSEVGDIKNKTQILGLDFQSRLLEVLPVGLLADAMSKDLSSKANLNISNVRGPSQELYFAGAKLQMYMPVSIPLHDLGLNVTGFSYNGNLWITITSCRNMIPDPAFFTSCIDDEMNHLVESAIAHGEKLLNKSPKAS